MKRVLLTGAGGLVGRHALESLVLRNYEVHAVSRRAGPPQPGVRWHSLDLLDEARARGLVADVRPTHLLHLAWFTEHGEFWESAENGRWQMAGSALAKTFAACGGARAVTAGTCAEYDWSREETSYSERRSSVAPSSRYGRAKDALRRDFAAAGDLSAAHGRIFFLFGPGEHPERLVASVSRALASGRPVPCASRDRVRDFLHAEDAGYALAAILDSDLDGPVNVASGEGTSVGEIVERLCRIAGTTCRGAAPDWRAVDQPARIVADVARLREELGWRPAMALDEGLARTLRWWRR